MTHEGIGAAMLRELDAVDMNRFRFGRVVSRYDVQMVDGGATAVSLPESVLRGDVAIPSRDGIYILLALIQNASATEDV